MQSFQFTTNVSEYYLALPGITETCLYRDLAFTLSCGDSRDEHLEMVQGDSTSPYDGQRSLCLIHFNDVYNIDATYEGRGGVASFYTALQKFSSYHPLIFFSGDVFNPSAISRLTKGRHMVEFLNLLNIHTACLGNHDLDFGVEHFQYLSGSTNFPWVNSNLLDAHFHGAPLGGTLMYRLCEYQGYRLGIFGLSEKEWLESLDSVTEDELIYVDYVEAARKTCRILREKNCHLIIALTHMRIHNDKRLAEQVQDIDFILGGHDHEYYGVQKIGKTLLVKSGTDFREFSWIQIKTSPDESPLKDEGGMLCKQFDSQHKITHDDMSGIYRMNWVMGKTLVEWKCIQICSSQYPPDPSIHKLVAQYVQKNQYDQETLLAINEVTLDTTFNIIRTQETNFGSMIANMMRFALKTDLACLNSGTIRSDCLIAPGPFSVSHLLKMLPMDEPLVVVQVTATELKELMEISVSRYPCKDGRFLQISGFQCHFNSRQPPMQRIVSLQLEEYSTVTHSFHYRPIEPNEKFSLCTKSYLKSGRDGYAFLKNVSVLPIKIHYANLLDLVVTIFKRAQQLIQPSNDIALRDNDEALPILIQCGCALDNGIIKIRAEKQNRIINIAETVKDEIMLSVDT